MEAWPATAGQASFYTGFTTAGLIWAFFFCYYPFTLFISSRPQLLLNSPVDSWDLAAIRTSCFGVQG
jgi:hypothetical protein